MYSPVCALFFPDPAGELMLEPLFWIFDGEWGPSARFFWEFPAPDEAAEGGAGDMSLFLNLSWPQTPYAEGGFEGSIPVARGGFAPPAPEAAELSPGSGAVSHTAVEQARDDFPFTHGRGRMFFEDDRESVGDRRGAAREPFSDRSAAVREAKMPGKELSQPHCAAGAGTGTPVLPPDLAPAIAGKRGAERALEQIETALERAFRGMLR